MIGPLEVFFLSIFAQLPAALFFKLAMSHSAMEQEGRAESARRKEYRASHSMGKEKRVRLKRLNQETKGERLSRRKR